MRKYRTKIVVILAKIAMNEKEEMFRSSRHSCYLGPEWANGFKKFMFCHNNNFVHSANNQNDLFRHPTFPLLLLNSIVCEGRKHTFYIIIIFFELSM